MSTTLNLADCLYAKARNLHELGREQDALHIFCRLANLRQLPATIAEETQARLAEIHLERGSYQQARRHLVAALQQQPASAHYHYLLAVAFESDEAADLERAAASYRRALHLEPDDPRCLCGLGLLALRLGLMEEGLKCLRQAAALTPDDPVTLEQVVRGLCTASRADEGRSLLRAALFRNPRDAHIRKLWNDFQYQELHKEQETARQTAAALAQDDEPVLLPFVRLASGVTPARSSRKRARRDAASATPGPHFADPLRIPNRKRAQ